MLTRATGERVSVKKILAGLDAGLAKMGAVEVFSTIRRLYDSLLARVA
jgi:hypothetical protein